MEFDLFASNILIEINLPSSNDAIKSMNEYQILYPIYPLVAWNL